MPTTTKAEERAEARVAYNATLAVCPSRQLLERISDKWVVLVLCALGDDDGEGERREGVPGERTMRYSELSRRLAGVSQKMLTQTLRAPERDGLLTRTVAATVPVTVSYGLADLGRSRRVLTRGIRERAQSRMDEVLVHREEHDARAPAAQAEGVTWPSPARDR